MQATGLATRIRHAHAKTAVVGLSGGLDSALALIVTVHAFDLLGRDRKDIIAITMPCFGTTSRTKNNALTLAAAYGTTCQTIEIGASILSTSDMIWRITASPLKMVRPGNARRY